MVCGHQHVFLYFWCKTHNTKFTMLAILTRATKWHLPRLECCATILFCFKTFSSFRKETPYPFSSHFSFPTSLAAGNHDSPISMDLPHWVLYINEVIPSAYFWLLSLSIVSLRFIHRSLINTFILFLVK